MDAPATTLVWMAPEPPDADQSHALASWSRSHGVKLAAPPQTPARALPVDARIAESVETLLQRARDAIGARDGDEADGAISAADSRLRAHPELPQAAWLMAEVERARATRWRRVPPLDLEAADSAWQRAEALDGGRVAGVGEQASSAHAPAATIALHVLPDDARVWIDGHRVPDDVVETRAGSHAVVVTWRGAPVWAAWIEAPPGPSSVRVSAVGAPMCSADDLAPARMTAGRVDAPHVRCRAWIAAAAGGVQGSVRVATCEADHCGAFSDWHAPSPWTWSPPPERNLEAHWPGWATWSLAGAGVAIATGVVLIASGILQPAPAETRFVSGGIKAH